MNTYQISDYTITPQMVTTAKPLPGAEQVLVRIVACGLNFADLLMIDGKYQIRPTPPVTLGMELAGVVESVGAQVDTLQVGMRVAVYAGHGGLAEYGCFAAERCVPIPDAMPFTEAAGILIAHGTSHLALTRRAQLQPNETLLVLGASGGVGLTAVEIGKRLGGRVIAVARGPEKLAIAKAAGADHVIDSETRDLRQAIIDLGRADVVYDPVGGDQFRAAFRAVNPEARLITIGFASGDIPQIPANHLLVKNLTVIGLNWGGYLTFNPHAMASTFKTLFEWYKAGDLHPHISKILPFDQVADGLDLLRSRKSTGKIIIQISKD